jgi:hypothetical protein
MPPATSLRRLELAVDDDPSAREVLTVDGQRPQRPAAYVILTAEPAANGRPR